MSQPSTPAPGSAADRAYEFAKWGILNGVYAAGEAISEAALAHELGLGPVPAREALLRLEGEGLVRMPPGHGAVVAEFSVHDVEDVLEARMLVESHTAKKSFAVRRALLPQVEAAHAAMVKSRRERDTAGFTTWDRLFHERIVDAADNGVLSAVYRTLRERQTLFTSALMRGRADRMDATIAEHERILDALHGDDEAAFLAVVHAHLEWSGNLARKSHHDG